MSDTATTAGLDPATLTDLLRVAGSPGFDRLTEQLRRTGGCSQPIHLTGATKTIDRATGTLLHHYSTDAEPGGRLRVACGSPAATAAPPAAPPAPGPTQATPTTSSAPDSPATRTRAPPPLFGITPASSRR